MVELYQQPKTTYCGMGTRGFRTHLPTVGRYNDARRVQTRGSERLRRSADGDPISTPHEE